MDVYRFLLLYQSLKIFYTLLLIFLYCEIAQAKSDLLVRSIGMVNDHMSYSPLDQDPIRPVALDQFLPDRPRYGNEK